MENNKSCGLTQTHRGNSPQEYGNIKIPKVAVAFACIINFLYIIEFLRTRNCSANVKQATVFYVLQVSFNLKQTFIKFIQYSFLICLFISNFYVFVYLFIYLVSYLFIHSFVYLINVVYL